MSTTPKPSAAKATTPKPSANKENSNSSLPELTEEKISAITAWLEEYPDTKHVWFNPNKEWSFHKREGFEQEVTREEFLGLPPVEDQAPEVEETTDANATEAEIPTANQTAP